MRENFAGSPPLRALDTSPLRSMEVSVDRSLHRLAEVAAFRVLGAAAMVLWARSGGPEGAKAPLKQLEPGLEGRLT